MAICATDVNAKLNETKITNAVCRAPCDVWSSGNTDWHKPKLALHMQPIHVSIIHVNVLSTHSWVN